MSSSPFKPDSLVIRSAGPMSAAFDAATPVIDVSQASSGVLLVDFNQDNGSPTAFARMRVKIGNLATSLFDLSVDDASAPVTIANVGLATKLFSAIKDFPAYDCQLSFFMSFDEVRFVAFQFAEVNQGGTPSVISARLALRMID